jgi:CPA2 family monovalent cation:H+ antiporter-2
VVVCWRESEALALTELPNVHVYKAAFAPALGLAEQVMRLGGVPVSAANGALSSMRQTTTA